MLNGIDISSWQKDIDLSPLPIDFVICKATEGIGYVNPFCDAKIQQAKQLNLLWGFYHFANDNDPIAECNYFIENTLGYQSAGVPVLDWETNQNVEWINKFVRHYHMQTGVWPWIYANPWRFNQGGVEPNCGRWVASYPNVLRPNFETLKDSAPPETDGLICAWQFCSDGDIFGYDGSLDLNYFYGDKAAWLAYALGDDYQTPEKPVEPTEPDIDILENEEYKVTIERK